MCVPVHCLHWRGLPHAKLWQKRWWKQDPVGPLGEGANRKNQDGEHILELPGTEFHGDPEAFSTLATEPAVIPCNSEEEMHVSDISFESRAEEHFRDVGFDADVVFESTIEDPEVNPCKVLAFSDDGVILWSDEGAIEMECPTEPVLAFSDDGVILWSDEGAITP